MSDLKFDSVAEARKYVYAIFQAIIDEERKDPDGWFFGGVENDFDKRRLNRALDKVRDEMIRKARMSL